MLYSMFILLLLFAYAILGLTLLALAIGILLAIDMIFGTHFGRKVVRKIYNWFLED